MITSVLLSFYSTFSVNFDHIKCMTDGKREKNKPPIRSIRSANTIKRQGKNKNQNKAVTEKILWFMHGSMRVEKGRAGAKRGPECWSCSQNNMASAFYSLWLFNWYAPQWPETLFTAEAAANGITGESGWQQCQPISHLQLSWKKNSTWNMHFGRFVSMTLSKC